MKIRVRIAPSPTGLLHIGTARTALFNYLFSKKENGVFILRSEDTDKERSTKEFEDDILNGLKWLGIDWDEGILKDGEYGPYRQTERKDLYHKHLKELIETKKAYYCFCSKEELEEERKKAEENKEVYKYSGKCSELSPEEVFEKLKNNEPYVIRLRMPNKTVVFNDLIRGEVKNDLSLMGDIIIAKNIHEPLYNFAVVVDDYLMKISHVIRGEDHITNTAKQLAIYDAFNWDVPIFAHLPLILNKDKTKLSKRNNLVSILDYKKEGYLSESIINFITLLGWHSKEDKEIISLEETINEFSLDRVQKGGAVFDIDRLKFLNKYYISTIPNLYDRFVLFGKENQLNNLSSFSEDVVKRFLEIERERCFLLKDFYRSDSFLFFNKVEKEKLMWKKHNSFDDVVSALKFSLEFIEMMNNDTLLSINNLQTFIMNIINNHNVYKNDRGAILWPLRYAISGLEKSPSPWEMLYVLGKEECIKRIKEYIE